MRTITIRGGKEKLLRRRHPWVLPRAVENVTGDAWPGERPDTARVVDSRGIFIAYGWHTPDAHTPVRLVSWNEDVVPDDAWLDRTVAAAIARRDALGLVPDGGRRLVFGEADGLPGFAVDQFSRVVVVQLSAHPAIERAETMAAILQARLEPVALHLVTDRTQTALDALPPIDLWTGSTPDEPIVICEGRTRFRVDLAGGQKTGFYLDQRDNRAALAAYAVDRRVLDAFSYSGGFACSFRGASSALCVDSSAAAGELVRANADLNGLDRVTFERADVFAWLRANAEAARGAYDLIILDPPKMARGSRDRDRAMRAYKDLVLNALPLISDGGLIALFSCSAAVGADDLVTASAWAALDAHRELRVVRRLTQAADHPILVSFPESAYLSGVLMQVD